TPKMEQAVSMRGELFQMRLYMLQARGIQQGDRSGPGNEARNHRKNALANIDKLEELFKTRVYPEEAEAFKAIKENMNSLIPYQEHIINRTTEDEAATFTAMSGAFGKVMESTNKLVEFEFARIEKRTEDVMKAVEKVNLVLLIALAVGALVGTLLGYFIMKSITKPVDTMLRVVKAIAEGDLSHTQIIESKDEVGILQAELEQMRVNFVKMIREIRNSAGQLSESSTGLSGAASQVSKGSESQSEAAAAMAAALEEMTTSIDQISALSDDARKSSANAGDTANSGAETIHSMVDEIGQMADAVGEGAIKSQELGKESEQISSIVHVIRDVADQTNLLALNAAIEAARAGEQGRGFAVVADEVRKLAEKTTVSAQEIAGMVSSIQSGSTAVSVQMESTSSQMQQGVDLAKKAGDTIGEITIGAQKVVGMIDEVSNALKEQAAASHDISGRVEQIVQMVEENSSAIALVSQSATELNGLAKSLHASVDRFRTA
ncbi:MAG: methyl-accepting chemotaxis protein, partial [Zoogloeaceae bacterium]|nr:methyl-accepting chemotaxis protein [Zoogloeaceae bacterium]